MKHYYPGKACFASVLLMLLLSNAMNAQCDDYSWALAGNGQERDEAYDVDVDAEGNIYLAGWFDSDVMDFGSGVAATNSSLGQNGNGDAYLVKLNPEGVPLWARSAGGASNSDWCWGMTAVPGGGAVIVGEFYSSTMSFGSGISLSRTGLSNAFIARYATDGSILWARKFGTSGTTVALGATVGQDNKIYVTGNFEGSIPFGSSGVSSLGGDDLFLLAYDLDGTELWARSMGGTGFVSGLDLATAPSGDIYVTGRSFSPTVSFNGLSVSNAGLGDLFILRYDFTGVELDWFTAGSDNTEEATSIAIDGEGRIYVSGSFWSSPLEFGPFTLISSGQWDTFLSRFTADLEPIWVKRGGGISSDRFEAVDVTPDGAIAVTGVVGNSIASFDGFNLSVQGIMHAGYDSLGNVLWAESFGGTLASFDEGTGLAFTLDGDVLVGGRFVSPSISLGSGVSISNNGEFATSDVFVLRRRYPLGLRFLFQPQDVTICEGDTAHFVAVASGTATYQWLLDGMPLAGETNDTLILYPGEITDAGEYHCEVSDSCETILSNTALLSVNPSPAIPVITINSTGDSLQTDGLAAFYNWFFNGTLLSSTNASIPLMGFGEYSVAAFTGDCGSAVSDPFQFTGLDLLSLDKKPLTLWPNPGNGAVTVQHGFEMGQKVTWMITDALGRLIDHGQTILTAPDLYLYPGALPAGIYPLQIRSEHLLRQGIWMVE